MSGIFGIFENSGSFFKETGISPMLLWNRAYGNASEDIIKISDISMGCCVENFTDIHVQNDPILSLAKKTAVIDALLFNRDELLSKCAADDYVSDAELLLIYIDRFGFEALKDVNGDFCGAIYDNIDSSLTLFRDHMGVRPLFFYASDEVVAFSSDIRGLTALKSLAISISDEWIYKTINGYNAELINNTAYKNVACVTPASYITFSFNEKKLISRTKSYWKLKRHKIRLSSETEYKNRLKELITDSVKRRLDAIPGIIGAELSGGLDSGVIDILINRFGRKGIFYSWSLDPKELPLTDGDERKIILDICEQENIFCNFAGTNSDFTDYLADNMKKSGLKIYSDGTNDFRFSFPQNLNTLTLFHTAKFISESGGKVVFTGHGGDEGVSHRCNPIELFHAHEYYRFLRYMWATTHNSKHRITNTLRKSFKQISDHIKYKNTPYVNWYASPDFLNTDFEADFKSHKKFTLSFAYDPVAYINSGGVRNRLDNIALIGAYGNVRYLVPYLDYRVIDFAVSIPRYLYLKGRQNRYIFREAFIDIMPPSLYKQNIKEDTSVKNLEPDPDRFKRYAARKEEILSHLNRDYWEKYLDFEKIDAFAKNRVENDDECFEDSCHLKALLLCALAQNMVEKSQKYTEP